MSEAVSSPSIDDLLGPDGVVARALRARGGYEHRPQQLAMARLVDEGVSSRRHVLVEAGTGVGKSFAYLVPLLAWAARTGRKAAVATSTIALQEQLVQQDLPLLADALPFPVSFALVKGRGNYLCTRRMHRALAEKVSLFEPDEAQRQIESILEWSRHTEEGTRQDLPFLPHPEIWASVRAEQGNCLGRRCEFYGGCHYQRSRRAAHAASVLVLNHHVLLADLALRRSGASFLPDVDVIVIDEAHDFESIAAQHLGTRLSSRGLRQQLGRLWSRRREAGLLGGWAASRLREAVSRAQGAARRHFESVADQIAGRGDGSLRIPPETWLPAELGERLQGLAGDIRAAAAPLDPELAMEVRARAQSLSEVGAAIELVAEPAESGWVRWIEQGRGGQVTVVRAPVDVGPLLDTVLWKKHDAVILTSATLATGDPPSFDFVRQRLGLAEATTRAVGSPFPYREQVRVRIRADLPDPARQRGEHEAALPAAILEAADPRGGTLVLFTSYAAMTRCADELAAHLADAGVPLRVQGRGQDRRALLEGFRNEGGLLFGVASFWQGVDLPGDALRAVVIARLPFEVPTHPLQEARAERLREQGRDPFRDFALPQAALRLKQGFGRLIRRSTDAGQVTILDPRVVTRSYGRVLLGSLPDCPREVVR